MVEGKRCSPLFRAARRDEGGSGFLVSGGSPDSRTKTFNTSDNHYNVEGSEVPQRLGKELPRLGGTEPNNRDARNGISLKEFSVGTRLSNTLLRSAEGNITV